MQSPLVPMARRGWWMLVAWFCTCCCQCLLAAPALDPPQLHLVETTPGTHSFYRSMYPSKLAWMEASHAARTSEDEYGALLYSIKARDIGSASIVGVGDQGVLARVRLRAQMRWEAVMATSWAGLFLRVDTAGGFVLAMDNMRDRPLKGSSTVYTQQTVVLDLPPFADTLHAGFFLCGGFGAVWVDDLELEWVGLEVPVTGGPPPWAGPLLDLRLNSQSV